MAVVQRRPLPGRSLLFLLYRTRQIHFLEQSSTIRVDGVGHDAVQIPPAWMLGGSVVPWFDRHVTEAMISSAPHSEVHPIEPHVVPSIDLT